MAGPASILLSLVFIDTHPFNVVATLATPSNPLIFVYLCVIALVCGYGAAYHVIILGPADE